MIWRWGKSSVISNVELGMLLILQCVVLASFLSTTVAWHHSPPWHHSHHSPPWHHSHHSPRRHHSPPAPSAPSSVPSPPFCSRSVATTIGSALLALSSLMIDAWGEASAQEAFPRQRDASFWRKVLWTILLGLNPIVGTFYVFQTMFVTRKFFGFLGHPRMVGAGSHAKKIAYYIADTWVTVGVPRANNIPPAYIFPGQVTPDPDLVLNLAGTGDPGVNRQWPAVAGFDFFLLNYEGMLALVFSGALNEADYRQLGFLGSRTFLETVVIVFQSISYIIAVVYRRIEHLRVTPIEGKGFAGSLLFLVHVVVQCFYGSRSKQGLLIYLTPAQENAIQQFHQVPNPPPHYTDGPDADRRAFILTFLVGFLLALVATLLVYRVLATKNVVDMLGHIIFFGDFLLQFIIFYVYFRQAFENRFTNELLILLVITGIISAVGVALAIYATIRHWHDQNFDVPTPLLGRYFPFIG